MTEYPRELSPVDIAPELEALIRDLASRMLDGGTPGYRILRMQLEHARIGRVTLTGAGLYAYFEPSPGAELLHGFDLIGGEVPMEVETLDAPAGSLLKVTAGRLDFLEIYTFGYNPWPDEPRVIGFGEATLLPLPSGAGE